MAQIKIFGLRSQFGAKRKDISSVLTRVVSEVLQMPAAKRAHRFVPLEAEDFFVPEGRSENYLILEIHLIKGRTLDTRRLLIQRLYEAFEERLDVRPNDLEIEIVETPAENWGFRGRNGAEVELDYDVEI